MPVVSFIYYLCCLMSRSAIHHPWNHIILLPSVFDPSFTVGAKYLIRCHVWRSGLLPAPGSSMFVLSGIIMAKRYFQKLFDVFAYFLGKFTAVCHVP